jgi:hypothetical protein
LQQGQQQHCNDSKDACSLILMTTPLQQGQQYQFEEGNKAIAMRATTPLQIKGNNAIVMRATMPAWWWQGHLHINNGDNVIAMKGTIAIGMAAKTPVHQRQWCHHNKGNNASSTTSKKGNNASSSTAEMPVHKWWQQYHCDKSNNCHCAMVKMPAHWWQWRHHKKGNNTSLTTSNKGNNASSTTAEMPAHQWQQWHHHNNGKDACALTTATTTLLQGQHASVTHNEQLIHPFFLGRIGFLSKTASSQPSLQDKKGLDKSDCTDSSMTPNNNVHHWTGWVEVASPPEG